MSLFERFRPEPKRQLHGVATWPEVNRLLRRHGDAVEKVLTSPFTMPDGSNFIVITRESEKQHGNE